MAVRPLFTPGAERTSAVYDNFKLDNNASGHDDFLVYDDYYWYDDFTRYADSVAAVIVRECGGSDPEAPHTYVSAATAAGLLVVAFYRRGGVRGWYERGADGRECLYYNTAYTDLVQARVLVHERAHSIIVGRERAMNPEARPAAVSAGYDDPEYGDEAHRLCRQVERLVVGGKK